MAVKFVTTRVKFDPTSGTMQVEPGNATFKSKVLSAGLAVNGWGIQYDNGDHNFKLQHVNAVETSMKIQGNDVSFSVEFLIEDDSGPSNPFSGWVDVLVIADVQ
jgi:hypothetical protein